MVIRTVVVRDEIHCAVLRIGDDEVVWESISSEHHAVHAGAETRKRWICCRGVVYRVQRGCQGRVISIRKIGIESAVRSKEACSSKTVLPDPATAQIDPVEYLIQQRRFAAGPCRIEGVFEPVIKKIRNVDIEDGIPLL